MPAVPRLTPGELTTAGVRRLLLAGGAALLIVFAIVVVVSALETRTVTSSLERVRTRLRPRAEAAYETEIKLFEVAASVLAYLIDPDTLKYNTFLKEQHELDRAVAVLERHSITSDGVVPTDVRSLQQMTATFDSAAQQLVRQRRLGFPSVAAERAARAGFRALRNQVDTLLDRHIQPTAIAEWHNTATTAQTASVRQMRVVFLLAILGTAIAVFAGVSTSRAYATMSKARDLAERSSQQKTEFASLTAHELRSPLTAVLGSLEVLRSGRAGLLPDEASRYIDLSRRSTAEMLQLINDLLELDRIEAGMMPFAKGHVEVAALVRGATDSMLGMAHDLGVTISFACDTRRELLGDPVRLRQVLTNLISNALKHAPKRSEVRVVAIDRDGDVRFTVTDSGPGIAPQDRERIFDRFVQTGSAGRHPSSGLGLAIAREIVLRHGGQLGVDSEIGRGASFWFEVPVSN